MKFYKELYKRERERERERERDDPYGLVGTASEGSLCQ